MSEEEIEYESDPEDAKLSLKLRRRVASDDEDEAEEGLNRGENPRRRIDESDAESEGAPADYEDELGGAEGGYDVNDECLEEEGVVEYKESGGGAGERRGDDLEVLAVETVEGEEAVGAVTEELLTKEPKDVDYGANEIDVGNENVADGNGEEERKEAEPFAVPTAGAFYMHDDRFRDNAGGRNRRMLGGRRLWESKDDRKWGHDKFEELTMQERHHEENRRGSRGRYRGRGRNRGAGRGYSQQNRPREYVDKNSTQHYNNNSNNQNNAAKGVRGRGPQRYQPSSNNEAPATQSKQSGKSVEKHHNASSGRALHPVSNVESDRVPRKQVASSLNISSPPFYPTGSSTVDSAVPLKRDIQASTFHRNGVQSMVDANSTMVQSSGKSTSDSIGLDKLNIDDSASAMAGKSSNTMLMPISVPSSINSIQPQLRGQGRAPNSLGQMAYQPVVSSNQINRIPSPSQLQNVQRNSGQSHPQPAGQGYVQQFAQRLPGGPPSYSPQKGAGATKSGETESTTVLSQADTAVVDKGKGGMQGSGKGSFLYGGHQVMGCSSGPGDQNFPAFLPVMQFGGQHPGGIGVPAVGMAFPGYVAQPQLGLGSSEMTWLPILTGAAGALGATYCPPYLSVDGPYNSRPSGTAPSTTANSSNQETSTVKVGNDWKPAQKPEFASHDFGQKQKNPRRYTEMKFDQ